MKLRPIGFMLGVTLLVMAGFMLVPTAVGWFTPAQDWRPFLTSAGWIGGAGLLLVAATRGVHFQIHARDAFLITTLVWVTGAIAGALPIVLHEHVTLADAIFESISGLTTPDPRCLPASISARPRSCSGARSCTGSAVSASR